VTVTLLGTPEETVTTANIVDPGDQGPSRVDVVIAGKAKGLKISMDEVYRGGVFDDTYIAEVAINFAAGDVGSQVERLAEYMASDSGAKDLEKNREEVIALYDTIEAAEFGDRDSLKELMDRAANGAPFLRRQVTSRVPAGFRVAALPADTVAIEALLKLKDSNAIPAIESAALRSKGKLARTYRLQVEKFRAFQEMVSGGNPSIAPFGQSGWEEGALKALGEPLPILVDGYGGLYVADVANHRVQRFGFDGIHDKTWGNAESGITNTWFYKKRAFYAAGAMPGEATGSFTNPVAMALVPGKDNDSVAVLDATGRVSIIGLSGDVEISFKIGSDDPISPGVGGEGHLVYMKKRLYVVWGNEVFVVGLDGEELTHFKLDDGVPVAAVVVGSKIGLAFGDRLVLYNSDGFRYGDVMNSALGEGFEAWDITADEKGTLWAVTDQGRAIKFKKAGKVDYEVAVADYSLTEPRIAVFDELLFVTSEDKIIRVDALEAKAAEELAAAEAEAAP
jgi:hypothetical protein